MAKRFFSTELWNEDWYIEMPIEYKLFWFYILSNCDHCGLFKVNLRSFCGLHMIKLNSEDALKYFNSGKDRIRIVNQSLWLIEDFFVYQYGTTLNLNNRVHESIKTRYDNIGIKISSIRGLKDLKDRVKDKDKDIDKESTLVGKRTKGGYGGKDLIRGEFFSDAENALRMNDGTWMKITEEQKNLIKQRVLKPYEILKNE